MNGSSNVEILPTKNTENVQDKILASGIQLRTSARVLKKQKLDLEASLAAAENKKDEKVEVEVTSSVVVTAPPTQSQPKRPRGICVLWSPEDKNAFFDALNEAGKDVEWIERYMRNKAKKRLGDINSPIVTCKSRLQIKSFFQRTITKISKYIQLPDNVKKSTQELYILINYGELRKRIGLINERNAQKLKELIYCGSTQVRVKGKTWRVKTPVCRALKRLNHLEESVDEVKLPTRVEVLLTPKENKDRVLVESLGYNPRLKTSLPVDTPIVNLINYLQSRWKTTKEDGVMEKNPSRKTALDKTPDPGGGIQLNISTNPSNSGVNNSISNVSNAVTNSPSRGTNLSVNIPCLSSSKPLTPPVICDSLPDLTDCIASPLPISNGSSPPRSQIIKETKEISSPGAKTRLSLNLSDSQMKNRIEKNETKITSSSTTSLKTESKQPLNTLSKVEVKTPLNSMTSKIDTKIENKIETVLKDGKSPLAIENRGKLWIGAKPNAPLTKTNYKCGQLVTSSCISLIAHQAKIGSPLASLQTLIQVPPPAVKASKSWAKWHKEGEPVDEHVNTDVCDPAALPSSLTNQTPTNVSSTSSVLPLFVSQSPSTTPGPSVTSTTSSFSPNPFPTFGTTQIQNTADVDSTPQSVEQPSLPQMPKEETKEEFEARVRKGWCIENTAKLRIADLYLIFGSNGKMEAEYWWEGETTSELPSLLKLLSLARLWYSGIPSSPRECWACGHKAPLHNNSNNLSQCSNQLIIDSKVEVKTEVVESSNSATAAVVVVSSSPTTAGRFRQPLLPAPSSTKRLKSTDETYKSLQLRPKYSNRRGRFRPKNVVVQRMLPLLPKTSTPPSCTVVTLQVVAGDSKGPATGEFINTKSIGVRETSELKPIAPKPSQLDIPSLPEAVAVGVKGEEDVKIDPLNFLTCTLGKDDQVSVKPELPATPSSFSGLLGCGSGAGENDDVSTPPPSPSRILKEGESQWLNSEVADFSLSSFLSHLESPVKTNGLLPLEDTRMSADVDSQLQSLMTESSLDYTAKFADLAAKIAGPGSSNGASSQPS